MDEKSTEAAIEDTTVRIYMIKDQAASKDPEYTGIVLEGVKVLQDLDNVAFAVSMLFALMYAMNLRYPGIGKLAGCEVLQRKQSRLVDPSVQVGVEPIQTTAPFYSSTNTNRHSNRKKRFSINHKWTKEVGQV